MGANDDIERRGKYNRGCDFRKSSLTGFLSSLGTSRTPCSSSSAAVRLPNSSRLPLIASAALADRDKFSRHVIVHPFLLGLDLGKLLRSCSKKKAISKSSWDGLCPISQVVSHTDTVRQTFSQ